MLVAAAALAAIRSSGSQSQQSVAVAARGAYSVLRLGSDSMRGPRVAKSQCLIAMVHMVLQKGKRQDRCTGQVHR